MRKTVTPRIYKLTKILTNDNHKTEKIAKAMDLSPTTVKRIRAAKSYKAYVRSNRERYTPVNKYDNLMTTYIETPQAKWWDRFKRRKA